MLPDVSLLAATAVPERPGGGPDDAGFDEIPGGGGKGAAVFPPRLSPIPQLPQDCWNNTLEEVDNFPDNGSPHSEDNMLLPPSKDYHEKNHTKS